MKYTPCPQILFNLQDISLLTFIKVEIPFRCEIQTQSGDGTRWEGLIQIQYQKFELCMREWSEF